MLRDAGYSVMDAGTDTDAVSCDYPALSYAVASQVAKSKTARGILVCMTGIGHSIAANKVPGAYAALCYNKEAAVLSRQHNNANVLVLGAKFLNNTADMKKIIMAWLQAKFEGGRHLRRFKQIREIEKRN